MTDWNSLDGNPAPGDPQRILNPGAEECSRIASEAKQAFEKLERIKYEFSSSIWSGETAIQFSKSLPTVIDDLSKLNRGYEQVAVALKDYARQLSYLQGEALSTLHKADVAEGNIQSSKIEKSEAEEFEGRSRSNRDRAESLVRNCHANVQNLNTRRLQLQSRRARACDQAEIAEIDRLIYDLDVQLRAAHSQLRDATNALQSAEAVLDEAGCQVTSASTRLWDASDQYQAERRRASSIRDDHRSNAKRAASAIRDAKGTAVGSGWDKFKHRVTQSEAFQRIQSILDTVADVLGAVMVVIERLSSILGDVSFIVSLLALVPGLNVMLAPLAAALLMVTTVLATIVLVNKIIEGKSSGWTIAADAFMVALGAIGWNKAAKTLTGAKTALTKSYASMPEFMSKVDDVLEEGMKTAFLSPQGFKTHMRNAGDFLTQNKKNLTQVFRGTFPKSSDIRKAIGGGVLTGENVAVALLTRKGTVEASTALNLFDFGRRDLKRDYLDSVEIDRYPRI